MDSAQSQFTRQVRAAGVVVAVMVVAEVTRRFAQQAMEWFLSPVHHISELRQSERTLSSLWRKRLFLSISVWRKSVLRSARTAVAEASMH